MQRPVLSRSMSVAVAVAVAVAASSLAVAACSPTDSHSLRAQEIVGNWSVPSDSPQAARGYWWVFEEDGASRYFDGCNWGGGNYAIEGGHIEFGRMSSTSRGCVETVSGVTVEVALTDPPNFRVVDAGRTLVVDTSIGEVRLDRVDQVPEIG